MWRPSDGHPPRKIKAEAPQGERRRHKRKYMQGALDDEEAFYFRGPEAKLNLKAVNLSQFLQIAEGLDHDTWLYHLRRHDYSNWFAGCIKDPDLAAEVREIESSGAALSDSRTRIRERIEARYTAPE